MKIFNFILTALIITTMTFVSSCKGDEPSAQEVQLKKLQAKTWHIQNVKVDGVDQTALFDAMTITFTKNGFAAINGSTIWPSTGTWDFSDAKATMMRRNDDVTVMIESLTDTDLRLSLAWNTTSFGPGRRESLAGLHIFDFN